MMRPIITCLVALALIAPVHARTDMSASLVAFWSLDDVTDAHSTNTLTNIGSTPFTSAKVGSGADFNGSSQYLAIADNAALSSGDVDLSVQAWVNFDDVAGSHVIFSKSDSISGTIEYGCYGDSSPAIKCRIGTTLGYIIVTCASGISGSTWYHLVFWNDTATDEIGCKVNDGSAFTESTVGTTLSDNSEAFRIGDDGAGRWMNGLVDQVAVWKRKLSSAEITELYNAGAGYTYSETIGGGGGGPTPTTNLMMMGVGKAPGAH